MDAADADGEETGAPIERLPGPLLAKVFGLLDARELSVVGQVCRGWRGLAHSDAYAQKLWKKLYARRWTVHTLPDPSGWHIQYNTRMLTSRSLQGRYQVDNLYGHKSGVRACKLLPSCDLLATGSLDKTVRLWSLSDGMPVSTSRPCGGTVRCLAFDAGALLAGSTDPSIRLWLPNTGAGAAAAGSGESGDDVMPGISSLGSSPDEGMPLVPHTLHHHKAHSQRQPTKLFDLQRAPRLLKGHRGPVSALCLTEDRLYSGSWDYNVRIWSRSSWECTGVLTFDDWVCSVVARGQRLLVSAGTEVYVNDLSTGQLLRKFQNLHDGHVSCLEGSQNGRMLFTGSADGLVLAHDLRMREPSCIVWHHNHGVHALSFEDPWLATASGDGTVILLNTETQLGRAGSAGGAGAGRCLSANCRQLQAPGGAAFCVDLADCWVVCGSESETVRTWDFSRAAEVANRAAAAKASRAAARMAKTAGAGGGRGARGHQQQHQQQGHGHAQAGYEDAGGLAAAGLMAAPWPALQQHGYGGSNMQPMHQLHTQHGFYTQPWQHQHYVAQTFATSATGGAHAGRGSSSGGGSGGSGGGSAGQARRGLPSVPPPPTHAAQFHHQRKHKAKFGHQQQQQPLHSAVAAAAPGAATAAGGPASGAAQEQQQPQRKQGREHLQAGLLPLGLAGLGAPGSEPSFAYKQLTKPRSGGRRHGH